MMKFLRIALKSICFLIIGLIVFFNVRIHTGPDLGDTASLNKDLKKQLVFLENEIKQERLGNRMQREFPEGFIFTNVLYGLSSCNLANTETDPEIREHLIEEARFAYTEVCSEMGKSSFHYNMQPHYGIFYLGWKNYLISQLISIKNQPADTALLKEYSLACDEIAASFMRDKSPYPESYPGSAWPADGIVAMASLARYDRLIKKRYDTLIAAWLLKIKFRLDPATGMLPHSVDASTGYAFEGSRGSSMALMLIFMNEIDHVFAWRQLVLYRKNFAMTFCGLPFVREYPAGNDGKGDVDSGPVIMGIGFAGTIVGIGTSNAFGDIGNAGFRSGVIEAFGFPWTSNGSKKYIRGMLPISDLFIAWSRSLPKDSPVLYKTDRYQSTFIDFHLYSLVIVLLLLCITFYKRLFRLWRNR